VQILYSKGGNRSEPILAAVGRLQFEVVQYRMETEYNVDVKLDSLPFEKAAWLEGDQEAIDGVRLPSSARVVEDKESRPVVLFGGDWELNYAKEKNPKVEFQKMPTLVKSSKS
ncbi:MAG TPA: peptide chain release factor 3, partial [Armatimonadota bacterium]